MNRPARPFYQQLGFVQCGLLAKQVRIDDVEDDEILNGAFVSSTSTRIFSPRQIEGNARVAPGPSASGESTSAARIGYNDRDCSFASRGHGRCH